MHFTDTVYRNPYWPTWPLLQITQGCTHNSCKFCTISYVAFSPLGNGFLTGQSYVAAAVFGGWIGTCQLHKLP